MGWGDDGQLCTCPALTGTQFPALISGGSQPLVPPALGNLTPSFRVCKSQDICVVVGLLIQSHVLYSRN